MKYYVYFDAYGHARQAISATELAAKYDNDPDLYLKAMGAQPETKMEHTSGHVGTLRFESEEELNEYLESLGDEISGFYGCRSESRPYNF
ncbi:MAG: hypothetical protein JSW39_13250 [Desulfobacterales bacterium]|nr:MAG: hypothetical protein JSW39_13250 [Desulfobacterales bacterium]